MIHFCPRDTKTVKRVYTYVHECFVLHLDVNVKQRSEFSCSDEAKSLMLNCFFFSYARLNVRSCLAGLMHTNQSLVKDYISPRGSLGNKGNNITHTELSKWMSITSSYKYLSGQPSNVSFPGLTLIMTLICLLKPKYYISVTCKLVTDMCIN